MNIYDVFKIIGYGIGLLGVTLLLLVVGMGILGADKLTEHSAWGIWWDAIKADSIMTMIGFGQVIIIGKLSEKSP